MRSLFSSIVARESGWAKTGAPMATTLREESCPSLINVLSNRRNSCRSPGLTAGMVNVDRQPAASDDVTELNINCSDYSVWSQLRSVVQALSWELDPTYRCGSSLIEAKEDGEQYFVYTYSNTRASRPRGMCLKTVQICTYKYTSR